MARARPNVLDVAHREISQADNGDVTTTHHGDVRHRGVAGDGNTAREASDVDSAFDDQEHEWYDLAEDPHELRNLASDRSRRAETHELHQRLLEIEAAELG